MNMMKLANINLNDIQIIVDGVAMRPIIVEGTVEMNPYHAPTLELKMNLPIAEYHQKKIVESGKALLNNLYGVNSINPHHGLSIVNVIFNEPATIVFWSDKSKTVVKAQNGEPFDPEKGLAMAILKRMQGNKGNYNNEFHQWTKNYQPKETNK